MFIGVYPWLISFQLSFRFMFDWLKRKKPVSPPAPPAAAAPAPASQSSHASTSPPIAASDPKTCAANPGKYLKGDFAFTRGSNQWKEELNVINCLSDALKKNGHPFLAQRSWIELDDGFTIMPRMLSFQPLEQGGVRTVTTIEVNNPAGIPPGVFEFQHSSGDNIQDSVVKGFESWMQTDLPVFLDALRAQPKQCTYLEIELPSGAEGESRRTGDSIPPARKRRVILGPIAHLVSKPLIESGKEKEEHPFCPCCLFTKTGDIWKEKIADGGFYGVRLFAMRGPEGESEADCRVNGVDWEAGKEALVKYVNTWPNLGVEFRKQYIVIHNAQ